MPIPFTVGAPKFWRHGDLVHVRAVTPYGPLSPALSDHEARGAYLARLDARADAAVAKLAGIARTHPGRALVLLCYERVGRGVSPLLVRRALRDHR